MCLLKAATTFNDKLEWSGDAWLADAAPSSESVDRATHAEEAWENVTGKIASVADGETQKVDGADFYTVVAPDADDNIVVSFQFQNNTGRALTLSNGTSVENEKYAYYSVKLNKKDAKKCVHCSYNDYPERQNYGLGQRYSDSSDYYRFGYRC